MKVYARTGCTSCQKAEAFLTGHGAHFERRDLFKQPLSVDELRLLLAQHGLTPRDVLSTRSRPYKELALAERQLTDDELLELMSQYPALIRRPLVSTDGQIVIGFDRAGLGKLVGAD